VMSSDKVCFLLRSVLVRHKRCGNCMHLRVVSGLSRLCEMDVKAIEAVKPIHQCIRQNAGVGKVW
jgi:hypothetical protein